MFDALERVGVDLTDVFLTLEDEGVEKFEESWKELLDTVKGQLDAATVSPSALTLGSRPGVRLRGHPARAVAERPDVSVR